MRPIIGKCTVVPHVTIKRVRCIEAVVAIVDSILRHLLVLFCSVKGEELLGRLVDDVLAAEGKGGLENEKRGSPGVRRALRIKLLTVYGAEQYRYSNSATR